MDFVQEQAGSAVIVRLLGRLDGSTARATEEHFKQALEGGATRLAIDMAGVDYLSSAGLRVLLVIGKMIQHSQGKLVLFDCVPEVLEVFTITGFDKLLPIRADSAAALAVIA